ncbi:nucleotidyl transferase AbiEii/AbiGii toxin family protein [Paenibacillus sp. HN-1]|uniref:nucleotidyl transferase AbiEii/AbiGii toxin family protein n=1 Tax=Paenibacillus TaxID=44249 RepID=UPI001CAA199B|nr:MULTISPECIES: nucleotidyl transferase AbiEii/AbiGii toxin family protein [Paenibacillus]MBY9078745.1 nucleotidyl transferase AbiEii/AbiGii toxin family protein [Paenibacillus sp. CGMCC 1.18879]MBY9088095.1 nucleotidyl transferase AbiEii/AbiGii toxin family protein [Paenibacillus sinensis]
MFWNVIDPTRQSVLKQILESDPVPGSYLAGGTALALLLGHRESIDFDWFTPNPFSPGQIESSLSPRGQLMISEAKPNTFHGVFNGVQVTWLHYPRPLLDELFVLIDLPQFKMASLLDIGVMKLIAASQRGAKKDFIDLYTLEQHGVPVTSLISRLADKFPGSSVNYYHIVKSLVFFEDADMEPMPRMLHSIEWGTIKDYFIRLQKPLLDFIADF